MNSKNMHYCYNVEYFNDVMLVTNEKERGNIYSENNRAIYQFEFQDGSYQDALLEEEGLSGNRKCFTLCTAYPGLFIGSGYEHKLKDRNAIVGGFYFDYVTGIPMIPGSTLKGMLRSYFQENKWEAVKELAENLKIEFSGVKREELEKILFEQDDVFIGGFPDIRENKNLLDSEYITPHKNQFMNPIPISLLKVRPGIKFNFIFLLHDHADGKMIMNAGQKADLYKELLKLGGIGAKTNVGFGQFQME